MPEEPAKLDETLDAKPYEPPKPRRSRQALVLLVIALLIGAVTVITRGAMNGWFGCSSTPPGTRQNAAETHGTIRDIAEGMTEDEVRKMLGDPAEIRRVDEKHLLDGTRFLSSRDPRNGETCRWAYNVAGRGAFARGGVVAFDKHGRVIAAMSPLWEHPTKAVGPSTSSSPSPGVSSPPSAGLTLAILDVQSEEARGDTTRWFFATATLKNSSPNEYRHAYSTHSLDRLSTVEIYDCNRVLIFRDANWRYDSPTISSSTLALAPGAENTLTIYFCPDQPYGRLEPGAYFLRVRFPCGDPWEDTAFVASELFKFSIASAQDSVRGAAGPKKDDKSEDPPR